MEGLGRPVNQMVTPGIFGYNDKLPELKPNLQRARQLLAEAGYQNGFKVGFHFTNDRLPSDRAVGTSVAQMLARIGLDVQANGQPAAVLFPGRTRGDYSFVMSGWGTITGEAHYVEWRPVIAGAFVASAVAFVLVAFQGAIETKIFVRGELAIEDDGFAYVSHVSRAGNLSILSDRARLNFGGAGWWEARVYWSFDGLGRRLAGHTTRARVAELADAGDSKSPAGHPACGFDPLLWH